MTKKQGKTCSLPTEAEWEYACRADAKTDYAFGDVPKDLGDYAWYTGNSGGHTHPVGGKKPNRWGLFDMNGNVYEWCLDNVPDAVSEVRNPIDSLKPPYNARMVRGGDYDGLAESCRCAYRINRHPPGTCGTNCGMRVCIRLD